jgi:putative copper resistance protein D
VLDWAILSARLLQYAGVSVLFGSSVFFLYGFGEEPSASCTARRPWAHRLLLFAAVLALAASVGRLMGDTASLTGELSNAIDWPSLWSIISDTGFGKIGAMRIVVLTCAIILLRVLRSFRGLWILQAAIGALVVASFAWTGHGSMDSGAAGMLHRGGDVLHLLAAAVWIGALVALSIQVLSAIASRTQVDAAVAGRAITRFSGVGSAVVATLIVTGAINSWFLIGPARWRDLFTTAYGRSLDVKLALFALMLVVACINRYRLAPALKAANAASSDTLLPLKALRRSLIAETALALFVFAVVAVLGSLAPPVSID